MKVNGTVSVYTRQPRPKVIAAITTPLAVFVGMFGISQTVMPMEIYDVVTFVSLAMIIMLVSLLVWYVVWGSYHYESGPPEGSDGQAKRKPV